MANVNTKAHVLVRDGFRCRYCDSRLILAQAIKLLDWRIPGLDLYDPHGRKEPLRSRWATVDHLVAEAEGGMDTLENLVACCVTCNSSKGSRPRSLPTLTGSADGWGGLAGVFLALAGMFESRLSQEDILWRNALAREGLQPVGAAVLDNLPLVASQLKELQGKTAAELEAMLPSIFDTVGGEAPA